ncbi:MAG: hypothetical protein QXL57_03295 [Candidatus Bathyarchaeia archaeon]
MSAYEFFRRLQTSRNKIRQLAAARENIINVSMENFGGFRSCGRYLHRA